MSRGPWAPSKRRGPICGGRGCTNPREPGKPLCKSCDERLAGVREALAADDGTRTYNSRTADGRRRRSEAEVLEDLLQSDAQPDDSEEV